MAGDRIFSLKPEIKISANEGHVLEQAHKQMTGKHLEIGFIVQDIAQKAVEDAVARYTMFNDKGGAPPCT